MRKRENESVSLFSLRQAIIIIIIIINNNNNNINHTLVE